MHDFCGQEKIETSVALQVCGCQSMVIQGLPDAFAFPINGGDRDIIGPIAEREKESNFEGDILHAKDLCG